MYFDIIKRDLTRKKTMNIILLLFIILASTFITSSTNNLITIVSALDGYLEKAKVSDFYVMTIYEEQNETSVEDFFKTEQNVDSYLKSDAMYFTDKDMALENGDELILKNTAIVNIFEEQKQLFFDAAHNKIDSLVDGEIIVIKKFALDNNIEIGDKISFKNKDKKVIFTVSEIAMDAFLGSRMMGMGRFLVTESDYQTISDEFGFPNGSIYEAQTSDPDELQNAFAKKGLNSAFTGGSAIVKMTYVFDVTIAGVLLVVSFAIIIISLVILRYTISYTLNEEYRQIGVMKAIGIGNAKIRGLYAVKYLFLSIIGSAIGFGVGIPFGNLTIKAAVENIITETSPIIYVVNAACMLLVIAIIVGSSYFCTRRIKKASPIDAIRNGETGERYKKKSFMRLEKSRLSNPVFLAVNDILCGMRKYIALFIIFTLGTILIILPVNSINTLRSGNVLYMMNSSPSDLFFSNNSELMKITELSDKAKIKEYLAELENEIEKTGVMVDTPHIQVGIKVSISKGDKVANPLAMQGINISDNQYEYLQGTAPSAPNEIAVSKVIADRMGIKVGDTVKLTINKVEGEYLVSAINQTMMNIGEAVRICDKLDIDYGIITSCFSFQINFTGNPSASEIREYTDKLKDAFPDYEIMNSSEYGSEMTGGTADQLESIKYLIVGLVTLINLLVSVLTAKSFITKERSEIALEKGLGFKNSTLIKYQMWRNGIIMILSAVLGTIVSFPISAVTTSQIFNMMGAGAVKYEIVPIEVFVIYPLLAIITVMLGSGLTALGVRKIKTSEMNIE